MCRLLVSRSPNELHTFSESDTLIELKLSWEHEAILRGEVSLEHVLQDQHIPPARIPSVHLPPGIARGSDGVRMALAQQNRGAITAFVHEQLHVLPEARLIVHPPRKFDHDEQLELIASMSTEFGRTVAVENLPDRSDWHSLASIAFFAYAGREYDRLSQLELTIDTAHLPPLESDPIDFALDGAGVDRLASRLSEAGLSIPSEFFEDAECRLSKVTEVLPAGFTITDLQQTPLGPAVISLILAGDRTSEIHLNDPVTDELPVLEGHDRRPLFGTVLGLAKANDVDIVLEPHGVDDRELISYASRLERLLEEEAH